MTAERDHPDVLPATFLYGLYVSLLLLGLGLSSCGNGLPDDVAAATDQLPERIDFNFHVKPILSDRCYACHGPDAAERKGDLRLDLRPDKPGIFAELRERLLSEDAELMMPPPESNLTISPREKAILLRWIEDGAEYRDHWAFTAVEERTPPTPQGDDGWTRTGVDSFILARLEQESLHPRPVAEPEILLRRLYLDLTGLPPTVEEMDDFLADPSLTAYDEAVDRLLASPRFGEHWAVDWMDVARYADTHGYTVDRFRDMSPWRDWVIDALNRNMPYDSFVVVQLAGDLLPNPDRADLIATGFNRNHPQNMEGGIVSEEFRVEYVADRTNTFGTAFLGLTMACARCHDHKYDPISQREYYETFAFFNNVNESGQISWDNATPVPSLLLPSPTTDALLKKMEADIEQLEGEPPAIDEAQLSRFISDIQAGKEKVTLPQPTATYQLEGSLRNAVTGVRGEMRRSGSDGETPSFGPGRRGRGLVLDGDAWLHAKGAGVFSAANPFTVGIWVKLPADLDEGVIFHKGDGAIIYNFRGYHLALVDGRLEAMLAHTAPHNAITKTTPDDLPRNEWIHLGLTYDGSSRAEGVRLFVNGLEREMEIRNDKLYKDILFGRAEEPPLQIGGRWRGKGLGGATVDEIVVYDRELTPPEMAILGEATDYTPSDRAARELFVNRHLPAVSKWQQQLQSLRGEYVATRETIPEIMIMEEMPEPRPAFILDRGLYDQPGEEVHPATVAAVHPFPDTLPRNRLGLALWLTSPEHPLFARVAVNRYWQRLFGRGIVATSEDFGAQGSLPTHPALLDWLAVSFRTSGYDIKALIRLLVRSATYRQGSVIDATLRERDPDNLLLARGPAAPLTAEQLRDNVLAAAQLLNGRIGGPSVYPYQPDDLWRVNGATYRQQHGDSLYRRGLYTVWKRSVPNPTQSIFDAPTRSECTVRRQQTLTPLQSLVLLNDPTFVEAARVMGERMARTENPERSITWAFRQLTGRRPGADELRLLISALREEYAAFSEDEQRLAGWLSTGERPVDPELEAARVAAHTVVASTIINLDATLYKR